MIVAVAFRLFSSSVAFGLPPQQSPIFGHRASSHTVCSPRPLKSFFILLNDAPVGILVFKCDGNRGLAIAKRQGRHRDVDIELIFSCSPFSITKNHLGRSIFRIAREEIVKGGASRELL